MQNALAFPGARDAGAELIERAGRRPSRLLLAS